ncbi:MAG TPA: cyclic nucleotide-binding domain-containing protein [bacterium]|nr:cyclic nucleotide-binding domain-containing protein [bacterium]HQG45848.1 cyclic nucleotide-binding domain-containing protein [bacterium]HQI48734.1 cyclic nucleotide-binding domain-containing protein [bacterium]HQJ63047.1 cyclic nucleotide-binding domain-containing protein [bacterium]
METLEAILSAHTFFKDLDPKFITLLTGCSSNRRYAANSYLFRDGEEANDFFLVCKGRVGIEIPLQGDPPIILQTVEEGDILGWSWLLPPYFWHFDARAQLDTEVIALDGRYIRAECEKNHSLGYEMLKRFAQIMERRLEATRLQLLDVYGKG